MSKINSNLIQEDLNNLHSIITDEIDSKVEDVYSTNEVRTNKVWIDGKPVYRKIFTKYNVSFTANTAYTFYSNITNLSSLCFIDVVLDYSDGTKFNFWNITEKYFRTTDNNIGISLNSSATFDKVVVIIEYTKTTD